MAKTIRISPAPRKPRTAAGRPSHEQIAARAYEIYLRRQGQPGDETADWLAAERELEAQGAPRAAKVARTPKAQAA